MNESVLVVGAGPVGLFAALWLAKLGVSVRIVERHAGGSEHSKALGVHANTLELLQRLDAAGPFLDHGLPARRVVLRSGDGPAVAEIDFHEIDSPYNYILIHGQSETEAVLAAELERQGVSVQWDTEIAGMMQDADGCVASFTDGSTSTHRYVIGCDGGTSTVRDLLGIEFEGEKHGMWFVLADAEVDWDERPDEVRGFVGRDGLLMFFPLPDRPRYRLVATLPDAPAETRPELSEALFESLTAARCPVPCELGEFRWQSSFQVRRRLAKRYRSGNVFIAGDAAHTHSPVGGQGLNTGLSDVSNLCWKIAAVLAGTEPASLLDTYESERRPVAKLTLFATQFVTDVGTSDSALVSAIRDQALQLGASLDVVRNRIAKRGSMTEFAYSGPQFGHGQTRLSQTELLTDVDSDSPSVAQRFEFARGPHPGHRAPDLYVQAGQRLLAGLGVEHALLLFDGLGPTPEGYAQFVAGCRRLAEVAPWIKPVVVAPGEVPLELAQVASVVLDPDLAAHKRYGASSEAGYLVRPDNYIRWRSQPMDFDALLRFVR